METQEYIEYMLQHHKKIRDSVDLIRRHIAAGADKDEIIESLAMPGIGYDAVKVSPTNVPTDRTAMIVDSLPRAMQEHRRAAGELRGLIDQQEQQLAALDRAVASISEPARNVILRLYYDGMTWSDIKKLTGYSGGTIQNYRVRGIADLVRYYEKYCTKMNKLEPIGIEM